MFCQIRYQAEDVEISRPISQKGHLRWTNDQIDTISLKEQLFINAKLEHTAGRCGSAVVLFKRPRKGRVFEADLRV